MLATLLFGNVTFEDNDDYHEFQFKFLAILLLSGAVFTLIFVVGEYSKVNPLGGGHVTSMTIFTLVTMLLWMLLRGRREWYTTIAWVYEIACLLEYASALYLVPQDELRILWLYINIPGVYILLGQKPGLVISILMMVGLAVGNATLSRPYSPNAVATALVSMANMTLFFHIYGARSISYYRRMREANLKLLQMATHDMLTGVLNARAYYARCDALINLARRTNKPFAVLFIDLDHFKSINDVHGHSAGDTVLKSIAHCLSSSVRQSDVVGRIGGEEFSIFLPDTDIDGACQLAEVLRQSVAANCPDIGPQRLTVTASIGVAGSDGRFDPMHEIQQRADMAMYSAKAAGRNRVSRFDRLMPASPIESPATVPSAD